MSAHFQVSPTCIGLAVSLAIVGGLPVAAQAPEGADYRACGVVVSLGCHTPAEGGTVVVTLNQEGMGFLTVETTSVAGQNALRGLRPGQHVCFTGKLAVKTSATEMARLDAVAIDDLQTDGADKSVTVNAVNACQPHFVLPRVLKEERPKYTKAAMRAGLQGTVLLAVVVDRDGRVAEARVTRSLDRQYGLDEEAIAAAKKWRFVPGARDGEPVPVLVTVEMTFTIPQRH